MVLALGDRKRAWSIPVRKPPLNGVEPSQITQSLRADSKLLPKEL